MIHRILALVSFTTVGLALAACGSDSNGNQDPGQPAPPSSAAPASSAQTTIPPVKGDVGTARRKAKGQDCCFKDQYFKCTNEAACYGGFDVNTCIADCAGDSKCMTDKCTDALRHAGAPTSDCAAGTAPAEFSCSLY